MSTLPRRFSDHSSRNFPIHLPSPTAAANLRSTITNRVSSISLFLLFVLSNHRNSCRRSFSTVTILHLRRNIATPSFFISHRSSINPSLTHPSPPISLPHFTVAVHLSSNAVLLLSPPNTYRNHLSSFLPPFRVPPHIQSTKTTPYSSILLPLLSYSYLQLQTYLITKHPPTTNHQPSSDSLPRPSPNAQHQLLSPQISAQSPFFSFFSIPNPSTSRLPPQIFNTILC